MAEPVANHWNLIRKKINSAIETGAISQAQIARELDWDPSHLNKYLKKGREPGLDKMLTLIHHLGMSLVELLEEQAPCVRIIHTDLPKEIQLAIRKGIQDAKVIEDNQFKVVDGSSEPFLVEKTSPLRQQVDTLLASVNDTELEAIMPIIRGAVKGAQSASLEPKRKRHNSR